MILQVLAALVLAQEPPPPIATPPPPSPEQRLAESDQHLASLDDEGARGIASALADDPTVPVKVRAQAALRVGIAEANLAHPDEAARAFKAALGQDPSIALPVDTQPKAQELFNAARTELATAPHPQQALPPREKSVTSPALGWVRPTSFVVMGAGGVMLVAGGVLALTGTILRWYSDQVKDPVDRMNVTRSLLPIALLAGAAILLSIPIAGTGLALFFLSGSDGPLSETRPDHEK